MCGLIPIFKKIAIRKEIVDTISVLKNKCATKEWCIMQGKDVVSTKTYKQLVRKVDVSDEVIESYIQVKLVITVQPSYKDGLSYFIFKQNEVPLLSNLSKYVITQLSNQTNPVNSQFNYKISEGYRVNTQLSTEVVSIPSTVDVYGYYNSIFKKLGSIELKRVDATYTLTHIL